MTEEEKIASKIKQRRYQMLVHSCLYYNMNENIVSDSTWSKWAKELFNLQQEYPGIASKVVFAEEFSNWTGDSGFDLPIDDDWVVSKATQLLRIRETGGYKQ